ncbi:sugar ABC transporter substrate-binding protein [Microbacterium sp. H1-D42]|uniref:ABC transporter substrate-binding protein n=1 Tax=Microbacterium sp. H1-D42 TaxID=2925844 RepID=UPI001F53E1DE|nr:sugar ABC transporter substrate-binding protein [Microbacterium sp. H1-D42]UNK70483.1 sugar ABC transporter substrate-binding protein [Microbacterium sp. H1-D42]
MQSRAIRYGMGTLGVFTVAALALTGCSSASGGGEASDGPVTLNYTIWDQNQEPALREAADLFEKQNDDVTVEITVVPSADYWTKLQTQLKAGNGPDVFWVNGPNFQLYASNDQLLPLDDAGVKASDYPKSMVDLYTFDGKMYGAPKDMDTIGVYYNKALFDQAGLDYPKAGWTWDDFTTAANKISGLGDGIYGTAAAPYGQMTYYNTILQAGGEIISADGKKSGYDTPEAAEGVQLWVDLINDGGSQTLQQITDTWPGDTFSSGKMGMFWDGSWAAGTYSSAEAIKDVIGVAPLPVGPSGENTSVVHGLANAASAQSDNPEWATKFAAFMGSKDVAEIQAKTATVIPAFNGTQQEWVDALPTIDAQLFLDAADTGVPLPTSKNTAAWVSVEETMIKDIYTGKIDTEAGLKKLAGEMNDLLAKE